MEKQSKILIVDDDQFALRSMTRVLGGESYQVTTAASGSEAIDLLKQDSFDLVLTDLKMPVVDGLEVLRKAREIAPQAVVLILTGYATLESATEALREGAYDYLVKPCSVHELRLKIEKGLERVHLAKEHKWAEDALRKAHDELERRVEERTAELVIANEQLKREIEERKRAEEQVRASLREKSILLEASTVISSTLDLEAVLTRIAEQMSRAVDTTSAYISSYEPETMIASVLAEYISTEACPKERVSDLGASYVEDGEIEWLEIMQAGQHDISHIDDPDLTESERAHMQQFGAETILYIPLRIKGQLIGYTELWESRLRREFTPEEIALCQGIAQQAAIALENARLYEQAQQEIAERKRAEERLKTSLKEKEVLLKEIHHRVKNNLQVISSLLHLQSKNIEDKEPREMFQDSQNRVRSMALVHEWLYQSKDLARVDFAKYVRNLTNHLFRSYAVNSNVIKLKINADDVFLGIDTAIPCGLITNELVSNSLKHAFPGGREGEISIEFCSDDDKFTLMVRDNGISFPKDLDFRNITKSLGLQLVNILVNQLEGTIELDRSDGTAFEITFTELK